MWYLKCYIDVGDLVLRTYNHEDILDAYQTIENIFNSETEVRFVELWHSPSGRKYVFNSMEEVKEKIDKLLPFA